MKMRHHNIARYTLWMHLLYSLRVVPSVLAARSERDIVQYEDVGSACSPCDPHTEICKHVSSLPNRPADYECVCLPGHRRNEASQRCTSLCENNPCSSAFQVCEMNGTKATCVCKFPYVKFGDSCILPVKLLNGKLKIHLPKTRTTLVRIGNEGAFRIVTVEQRIVEAMRKSYPNAASMIFTAEPYLEGDVKTYSVSMAMNDNMEFDASRLVAQCLNTRNCGEDNACLVPPGLCIRSPNMKDFAPALPTCDQIICLPGSHCQNNTVGKLACSCMGGYRKIMVVEVSKYLMNEICEDINECEENSNVCEESSYCLNTPGSYKCICNKGYVSVDGHKPIGMQISTGTVIRCQSICEVNNPCQNGGNCSLSKEEYAGYACKCPEGFNGTWCENGISVSGKDRPNVVLDLDTIIFGFGLVVAAAFPGFIIIIFIIIRRKRAKCYEEEKKQSSGGTNISFVFN